MVVVTVGRILHYIPSESDPLYNDGSPLASIVAAVKQDGEVVNLTVSGANGHPVGVVDVPFVVEGDPVPTQSYATWPQREQAKQPASPETTGADGKSAAGLAAASEAAG